ncbi:Protein artemis [Acropora cervicornis]|uniref:Protein artemis n=1 Tax=Acropora cervicornis TaxID=6130 RepID=A0AAD9PR53_ACRCE|nr:Protein artemis [Acropora cervicornis]
MSSFTGKFKEYPMISADNFEKENLSSLAFFLSHCHKGKLHLCYIASCWPLCWFCHEQSRDATIELIERWFSRGPQYVVSLLCKGMYGFEYLLKEVHISPERLRMYRYLPDMLPYFTTDGRATKIHACKWQTNRHADSDLPCGQSIFPARKMKVLRIKPATMWVALSTEGMPADFKRYDKEQRVQDLVGYLKPYHAYPNVPPAGVDTLEDAFERLRGLTRLHECNSCNKDESDELHFKEITPEHCS